MRLDFNHKFTCRSHSSQDDFRRLLWKNAGETREVVPETPDRPPFAAESAFNPSGEWNFQVIELIKQAMGEKYHPQVNIAVLTYITTGNDYVTGKFKDALPDITKMKLENGKLFFLNEAGEVLSSFDIDLAMKEIIKQKLHHDCDICRRRMRRIRLHESRNTSWGDFLLRTAEPGPKKKIAAKSPLSEEQKEANLRMHAEIRKQKEHRDSVLKLAETWHDEETYDLKATVPSLLGDDTNKAEFEEMWRHFDGSDEIDRLMRDPPDPRTGYTVNPFDKNNLNWNHEKLRDVIQGWWIFNRDDTISFQDIEDEIYENRFEEFCEILKKGGTPEVIIKALDEDDLVESYKKLKRLRAELAEYKKEEDVPVDKKELYKNRRYLDAVINVHGDYIAYANKLVNLIDGLKYNPARETADREATISEETFESSQQPDTSERNRVIRALKKAFSSEDSNMYEYSGELNHWFSVIARKFDQKGYEASLTFDDLNGETASIEGEWFTRYQSPEAAYKLAYEAARGRTQDGHEKVDEAKACGKLNDLLHLGIAVYTREPGERSMKDIFEELRKEGAEVEPGIALHFSATLADADNLYHTLELKDLSDIHKNNTDLEKLMAARRNMFMRIGSVIRQKESVKGQTRSIESIRKKGRVARLRLTLRQARDIAAKLEESGKFKTEELQKLRDALVGGVVATIEGDKITGGAVNVQYKFSNGVTMTITGGIDNWDTPGFGVTVGRAFEVSSDMTIGIHGGAGLGFTKNAATEGWLLGGGGQLSKKFGGIAWHVEAGAGVLPVGLPAVFAGTGLQRIDEQERYETTLKKKQIEHHLNELDASEDTYKTILDNSSRYPEFKSLIYQIQNAPSVVNESSRRDVFMAAYDVFKDGIQQEAIDDSTPKWYERLLPTGIGGDFVIVVIGGVPVPIPYAYLEWQVATRNLVFRLASSENDARLVAEGKATQAILNHYKKATKVETKPLLISGELVYDPSTKSLRLTQSRVAKLDLSHLDNLGEFSSALYDNADIFVKPADIDGENKGLLELSPRGAYGNIRIYIDPQVKDDVVITWRGAKLYASIKNNKQLVFKRQDITYPFKEAGAIENTIITVSENPLTQLEVIRSDSQYYMYREPNTEWVRREANLGATPKEREARKQEQIKTFYEYINWLGENHSEDRLEFFDFKEVQAAHDILVASISVRAKRESEDKNEQIKVRDDVKKKIKELAKKNDFIEKYRDFSTKQYDLVREGKTRISSNPKLNLPDLISHIENSVEVGELNVDEMNFALSELMIASFQDIHKYRDVKKTYENYLDKFHAPLLKSIVSEYYKEKGDKEGEKKTEQVVTWMMSRLKKIDITKPGVPQHMGVYMATLVGMKGKDSRAVGLRRLFNFREDKSNEYGLVGGIPLNPNSKNPTEKEVARFWLEMLSPYTAGLHEEEIPETSDDKYSQYQKRMSENLYSPLALKLAPLIAVVLTPAEMKSLAAYYDSGTDTDGNQNAPVMVNESNIAVIKKFLQLVDKVRTAQIYGIKEIDLGQGLTLLLRETSVQLGVYKECGNPTGIMSERFEVVHKSSGKRLYYAGMGEGTIDVDVDYSKENFYAIVGLSYRFMRTEKVKPPEEPTQGDGIMPDVPVEPEPRIPTAEEKPKPSIDTAAPAANVGAPSAQGKPIRPAEGGAEASGAGE